jgi:phosphoribosylglycinamide formyltransferase-1
MPLCLGVLLSGSGTNLQAIIDRIEEKILEARIAVVISNVPGVGGLERARKHGLQTRTIDHRGFDTRQEHDAALISCLREHGVQAVCLAGYMRLVSSSFVQAFPGRILNIHPSLLPAFKGVHAQDQAARYGVRISGATVHFVDEHLDHGPIIIQGAIPVASHESGDELSARILEIEHRIYPQAIQWLAQDRLRIEQGRVFLEPMKGQALPALVHGQQLISPGLESGF